MKPTSTIDPTFLAYIRTGAYMNTLDVSPQQRAVLPPSPWPSPDEMEASIEARHGTATIGRDRVSAMVARAQPSYSGSVMRGVGSNP